MGNTSLSITHNDITLEIGDNPITLTFQGEQEKSYYIAPQALLEAIEYYISEKMDIKAEVISS